MSETGDLTRIVLQWQLLQQQLESVSPEELCRDQPELLPEVRRRIEALRQVEQRLSAGEGGSVPIERAAVNAPEGADPGLTTDHFPGNEKAGVYSPELNQQASQETTDDAPRDRAGAESPVPLEIAGYEILTELGRGGMGVVYKARQQGLNRLVALKMILHADHAGEAERERFTREAEAIAKLQHPNIVQIHEIGEHEGKPYFSLELVQGGSLDDRLDGAPLPAQEAAQLVDTLARAMHVAHQLNILHRDLKPANILLTEDGTPKITDFGLAKKLDEAGQTATGAVMGTPSYMAPEQASGKVSDLGPAADVYAIGAILYECLTGRPPFKAATLMDTILQVIRDEPVAPSHLNRMVPRDLETICLKCLDKEPAKRYNSALDLAEDLQRFQRSEPILARPVGQLEKARKWVRRNPVVAGLLSTVLVVLAAGVVVSSLFAFEAKEEAKSAREAETRAKEQARRADHELAVAELRLYAGLLTQAQREHETGRAPRAIEILEGCRWDHRDAEFRHLWNRFNSRQTLIGHSRPVSAVSFSPDGKRILTGSWDKTAKVWDAESGREIFALEGHKGSIGPAIFSPDGKRILTGSRDNTAKVWDSQSGKEIFTLNGASSRVAFSPDGKRILTGGINNTSKSWEGTVKVWNAESGQMLRSIKVRGLVEFSRDRKRILISNRGGSSTVWDAEKGQELFALKNFGTANSASFSPDGKQILAHNAYYGGAKVWDATNGQELFSLEGVVQPPVMYSPNSKRILTGGGDTAVKVWDAKSGEEILTLRSYSEQLRSMSFSPDGARILISHGTGAEVWDARKGRELFTLKGHGESIRCVSFSPDGTRILTGSHDKTAKIWDARWGQEMRTLNRSIKGLAGKVAFSPNGKRILTGETREIYLWDAESGHQLLTFEGHSRPVTCLSFSPDGRRIASGSEDKTAKVWDAQSGKEIVTIRHARKVGNVRFSPDGRRILTGSHGTTQVWDAETGRKLLTLKGQLERITCARFSPDGKHILIGCRPDRSRPQIVEANVLDAESGQVLLNFNGHRAPVIGAAFAPDGRRILTSSTDGMAKVWSTETGKELFTLRGVRGDVRFSPNGKRILTGGTKVWDAEKGQLLLKLKSPPEGVTIMRFSPDGSRILTGGYDPTTDELDATRGRGVLTLKGHVSPVTKVKFSSDGNRIFAWDRNRKMLAWSIADGKLAAAEDPPQLPPPGPARSPNGSLFAEPRGSDVTIVENRYHLKSNVWPLPNAIQRNWHHTSQAKVAEKKRQWFAVAFHLGRLLLDDPDNAELKNRREEAWKKHSASRKP